MAPTSYCTLYSNLIRAEWRCSTVWGVGCGVWGVEARKVQLKPHIAHSSAYRLHPTPYTPHPYGFYPMLITIPLSPDYGLM